MIYPNIFWLRLEGRFCSIYNLKVSLMELPEYDKTNTCNLSLVFKLAKKLIWPPKETFRCTTQGMVLPLTVPLTSVIIKSISTLSLQSYKPTITKLNNTIDCIVYCRSTTVAIMCLPMICAIYPWMLHIKTIWPWLKWFILTWSVCK